MQDSFVRRRDRFQLRQLVPVILLTATAAACGASKGPTEPGSGSSGTLSAPSGLAIANISVKDRTTTFTWNAVAGATGYLLEIGSTTNGAEFAVITLDASATSHAVNDLPLGISFARVRAKNPSTTTAASTELRFGMPDIRDIVEALFLGTGPNSYDPNPNPSGTFWAPWPPGRQITTRVAGLNDQEYGYVEQSLQQIEDASNGSLRGSIVERLGEPFALDNLSRPGELRVVVHPDMQAYCGNASFGACAAYSLIPPGVIGQVYVASKPAQPGDNYAHELGHAVLGLKHIYWGTWTRSTPNERAWPGLPSLTMTPGATGGPPALSPTEVDAIKMVFAAGLPGGARRSAFYAAGLINNP